MADAESSLENVLDSLTTGGVLVEKHAGGSLTCYACGHRCLIKPGRRGICQVRFNQDGELRVPWGYVGALQCDPTEKKPFFHVYPGSDTLTFGMLGCDMHCPYCFPPGTLIETDRGQLPIERLFNLGQRYVQTGTGQAARPAALRALDGSGHFRRVLQVFKHDYTGDLTIIRAFHLPELRCTPDHGIYATTDPARPLEKIEAGQLTRQHFLAVPRAYATATEALAPLVTGAGLGQSWRGPGRDKPKAITTPDFFLVPISELSSAPYDGEVYNLEVEGEHNYLANFALVSNCQNWVTSQALRDPASAAAGAGPQVVSPRQLVGMALQRGAQLVGSSYNEPLITSEWAVSVFQEAVAAGLKCAFISNGNATREVLEYIRPYVSAYKIDLKTMSDRNYRRLGAVLEHVLDGIRMVHELGFWLEIVTLVIPGFNDSDAELADAARFLAGLSPDIPWHVTAFHQDYHMTDPDDTTAATLLRAAEIGQAAGLRYVYAGNMPGQVGDYEHTFCPTCHTRVIARYGYVILDYQLGPHGACLNCGTRLAGIWTDHPEQVRRRGPGAPRSIRSVIDRYRSDLAR
jgi:pyruvate formate lyase activating enzyme